MAQSNVLGVVGAVSIAPASSALFTPASLQQFLSLNLDATYGAAKGMERSVAVLAASPETLPLEGITKLRFLALRVLSGATMQVWLTTALGVAKIPVSDALLWHAPNPGDEATLVQIVGTADFQYVLAGDLT